jgi:hypothetical protein
VKQVVERAREAERCMLEFRFTFVRSSALVVCVLLQLATAVSELRCSFGDLCFQLDD